MQPVAERDARPSLQINSLTGEPQKPQGKALWGGRVTSGTISPSQMQALATLREAVQEGGRRNSLPSLAESITGRARPYRRSSLPGVQPPAPLLHLDQLPARDSIGSTKASSAATPASVSSETESLRGSPSETRGHTRAISSPTVTTPASLSGTTETDSPSTLTRPAAAPPVSRFQFQPPQSPVESKSSDDSPPQAEREPPPQRTYSRIGRTPSPLQPQALAVDTQARAIAERIKAKRAAAAMAAAPAMPSSKDLAALKRHNTDKARSVSRSAAQQAGQASKKKLQKERMKHIRNFAAASGTGSYSWTQKLIGACIIIAMIVVIVAVILYSR